MNAVFLQYCSCSCVLEGCPTVFVQLPSHTLAPQASSRGRPRGCLAWPVQPVLWSFLDHWWLVAVTLTPGYYISLAASLQLSLGKPLLHSVQHYLPEVKHRTWKWRVPRNAFFLGSILRFNVRNIFPTCQLSAFWHEALVSNMSTVEACASVEARGPTCRWSPW